MFVPFDSQGTPDEPLNEKVNRNEWIRKGDSLFVYRDDYEGAGKLYLHALRAIEDSDEELAAICKIKLGNVYISLEKYQTALNYLSDARTIIDNLKDPDKFILQQYNLYFGKYLLRNVELDSAAVYIDRAIDINREYFSQDQLGLAEGLFFRAEIFDDQSNHSRAEELYQEIESIYDKILEENHILLGRLYAYMGRCLRSQLDYTNATDYIEKAIYIFRMDSLNNLNRLAVATFYLTSIYNKQKKYENLIPPLESILKLIKDNVQLERFLLYYYSNLITAYIQTNQLDKARNYIDAYHNYVTSSGTISPQDEAFLYFHHGEFNLRKKNYNEARDFLKRAYNLFKEQVATTNEYINCILALGDLYMEMDMPDSALYHYQLALIENSDGFSNDNIYSNPHAKDDPNQRDIFEIIYRKARAFSKYYVLKGDISYLKEALHIYNLIDKLNDEARNSNLRDASLLILNEYFHQEYERAIDCAYELFSITSEDAYLDSAFRLMEKNKSMILFKSLMLAERSRSINLPYSIKKHEDSLLMLNLDYEQKIRLEMDKDLPDQAIMDQLENQKFKITQELYNLKLKISKTFPTYYQIRYDSIVKDLDDFKNFCLKKDLLGIEYFWGDSNLYQIITDGNSTGFFKQKQNKKFQSSLNDLLLQLSHGIASDSVDIDYKRFNLNAHGVYKGLLGNLAYEKFANTDNLLIIPDGMLAQLPFEALISDLGDTSYTDYSNLPYMIFNTSIAYAYSVNVLLNPARDKKDQGRNLLAFSYSGLNTLGESLNRTGNDFELPHAAVELNAIREVFPGKNRYFFDDEATEHDFKLHAPDYQILHLAVHGVADMENGENSRLIFKQGNDTIDDSSLYMHELYGMDLTHTQLAVLSACETGIGKEFRGEGVFSMARGFIYAGCPTIIMSLWPVGDEFSAGIMAEFYRLLKKGIIASGALRNAKLNFIKKQDEFRTHPANWASFVYLGEEFQYEAGSNRVIIFSVLIFLIISISLFFRKYIRSRFTG
ncbi:MAG: CHAT domain-containing protein [Cyclobacteriaceae bacterium]|nr:CHAT domain-containing protein [Cyclobacteriaceae bacterium]